MYAYAHRLYSYTRVSNIVCVSVDTRTDEVKLPGKSAFIWRPRVATDIKDWSEITAVMVTEYKSIKLCV